MKKLVIKYKDIILYGIFGLLTTLVNIIAYWLFAHVIKFEVMPSTIIAWILAVSFAYLTNRNMVFHSEAHTKFEIIKEIISFFACRIATGIIDWLFMLIFVNLLHINDMFIKIIANIVVIILNFIASKMIIFKKNKNQL